MHRQFFRTLPALAVALVVASSTTAATIAEWNFNSSPGATSASTGFGTVSGVFVPLGGGFGPPTGVNVGSPADTNPVLVGGIPNNSVAGRSGPLSLSDVSGGDPGGPDSIRNMTIATSTVGFEDITVSWNALQGFRASRYHQLYATTDGVTFAPVPTGTGSSASVLGSATLAPNGFAQTSQSATVSDDGLVTIITDDNMIPDPATGAAFIYELSYTFPSGFGVENNPNFAVKIGAIEDPNGSDYVSSFAGTTEAADSVSGYIRSTAAGGNATLYDLVRVSGVPEPTSMLLVASGVALVGFGRRRSV